MFLKIPMRFCISAILGLASISLVSADTVILKSGEELEGTIELETAESIVLAVQVTKSIRDNKTISKADIKEIIKLTPAAIAFEKLKSSAAIGDMQSVTVYDSTIDSLKQFLTQFPDSLDKKDAEETIKGLEAEREKIANGNVKLGGEWVTPEAIAADPYNHGANVIAARMEEKIAEKEYTEALSEFEKLQMQFDESKAFARTIPAAKTALDNVDAQLALLKRDSEFKIGKRQTDLAAMPASDRVNTENAFNRQMEIYKKNREELKAAGQLWLPTSVWDPESIEDAIKTAEAKRGSIESLDAAAEMKRAAIVEQVILAMDKNNWAMAATQVGMAQEAGADSEKFKALSEAVEEGKKIAAADAKAIAEADAKAMVERERIENEKRWEEKKAADEKAAAEAAKAEEEAKAKRAAAKKAAGNSEDGDSDSDDEDAGFGSSDAEGKKKDGGIPLPLIIGIVAIMAVVSIFMIKSNKSKAKEHAEVEEELDALSNEERED